VPNEPDPFERQVQNPRALRNVLRLRDLGSEVLHLEWERKAPFRHRSSAVRFVTPRAVAAQFSRADFSTPLMVHGEKPAGVDELTQLRSAITYTFELSDVGGRVKIVARSADALKAVHEFLRYQIREHRTGDPPTVDNK
jgi:hypothetical protein